MPNLGEKTYLPPFFRVGRVYLAIVRQRWDICLANIKTERMLKSPNFHEVCSIFKVKKLR